MVLCRQVSAACEKMYKIMVEVIKKSDKKVINDHGLGCWWGGVWIWVLVLMFKWTPSVGVSVTSVLHSVSVEGLTH